MKTGPRIYRWVLISVIMQLVVLLLINNYLSRSNNITAVNADLSERPKRNLSVKIPDNAAQIKISYDGSYAGYFMDNKLVIIDLQKKKTVKTITSAQNTLTYYRWLPDRDMVIYAVRSNEGRTGRVQIFTYGVDSDVEHSYPGIKNLSKGSEITGIELSPLTNIVYIKVKLASKKTIIYKFNIMNNINYVMNSNPDITIKETNYSDTLLYQYDGTRVYMKNGRSGYTRLLPLKSSIVLLGIDSEDKVYVGELNKENMVEKIYYARLPDDYSKMWNQVVLQKPALPDKITITQDGGIFMADESENMVYDILGKRQIKFDGTLVEVLDNYIITRDGNRLKLSVTEKKQ